MTAIPWAAAPDGYALNTLAAADAYMTARTDEHEDYADYRRRTLAELEDQENQP